MLEDNTIVELKDEKLEKVNGSTSIANEGASLSSITIEDVVEISGYISGFDGRYCLVSINEYGAYKFVKYQKGAKYIDDAIRFATILENVVITKIGHDDEFVKYNA